jgi:fatty-acyl-CoA synthase
VDAASIFDRIRAHRVTHYCGAPIVHALLANAPPGPEPPFTHPVEALAGGAPPPAALIESLERIGIRLTHSYGLTETYGPAAACARQPAMASEDAHHRAEHQGRQGVRYPLVEAMEVRSPVTLEPVPRDGETLGEILFRGNSVMRGYLKNPRATEEALEGGWLHTGDLAVVDPDGYVRIRDRSKDVIISGGENIASLEVEEALYRHPAVLACAVVARPDPRWGETPCAFVEARPEAAITAEELIEHCRAHLAHYKAPRHVVFGPIPRTATGKIQKYVLRDRARAMAEAEAEGSQKEG